MTATVHLGFKPNARLAANIQSADTFGAVSFVRRQAHQINGQCGHVDVNPTRGLRRIDMENDPVFTAQVANGSHVLNHANFVVHKHHAEQYGVRPNGCFQHVHVQQTVCLHVKVRRVKPLPLQFTESVEHGFVLGFDRDDVLAFCFVKLRCTLDREII